ARDERPERIADHERVVALRERREEEVAGGPRANFEQDASVALERDRHVLEALLVRVDESAAQAPQRNEGELDRRARVRPDERTFLRSAERGRARMVDREHVLAGRELDLRARFRSRE